MEIPCGCSIDGLFDSNYSVNRAAWAKHARIERRQPHAIKMRFGLAFSLNNQAALLLRESKHMSEFNPSRRQMLKASTVAVGGVAAAAGLVQDVEAAAV